MYKVKVNPLQNTEKFPNIEENSYKFSENSYPLFLKLFAYLQKPLKEEPITILRNQ